jgi:hypothetical protein
MSSSSAAPVISAPASSSSSSSKPKKASSAAPKRHAKAPAFVGFKRAGVRRLAVKAHCTGITRRFVPEMREYLTRVTKALVKTAIILAGDKKTLQTKHLNPAIERVFSSDRLRLGSSF